MAPGGARAAGAALGILADRLLGEPPAAVHPVAAFGAVSCCLEKRTWADSRPAGAAHAAIGVSLALLAGRLLSGGGGGRRRLVLTTAGATWTTVAGRGLAEAAGAVARALDAGDLEEARRLLPSLVGRDPRHLDEAGVARAVVESLAENTVDAVVAPALWAAVGGPAGTFAHKAFDTLDSMIGHRSPRYARFGWASARGDDIAAWVPARVTAVLVAAVRPGASRRIWEAVRVQAPAHPSPNAGVAEAAFAAALGLRLGGTNTYDGRVDVRPPLGEGAPPRGADIPRAVTLMGQVSAALAACLTGAAALPALRRAVLSPR